MMKKLFNRQTAKIYIVLICITLIAGLISSGFCISYSSKLDKLISEKSTTENSDILSTVVSALSGNEESTGDLASMLASTITSLLGEDGSTEEPEEQVSAEEKALQNKKLFSLISLSVFFVLCVVFSAATIAGYQYEKYLDSPKYKAKLKRMKKYEKIKNN